MTRPTDTDICRFVDSRYEAFAKDGASSQQSESLKNAREHQECDARKSDRALHKRLDQLRAAMGDETMSSAMGQTPVPTAKREPTTPVGHRMYGASTVIATGLVSASMGAVGAWSIAFNADGPSASMPVASQELVAAIKPSAIRHTAPTPNAAEESPSVLPIPSAEAQLGQVVETWRKAWSGREVDTYLAHYSENFVPRGGQTRTAWAESRRKNIEGRASINIAVYNLQIERVDEQRFRVAFLQDYSAGNYSEVAQPKIMELVREGNTWRIVSERQITG